MPVDERKGIFVTRMYGGTAEDKRKSHELVAAAVWRKTVEHVKVEDADEQVEEQGRCDQILIYF